MPPSPRRDVSFYSRAVRWLKVGLPLLALALLSAIFLLPREHEFDFGLVYSTADLVALGEGLSVSNPRIAGSTEAGEPYVLEADSATPDSPDPERVELDRVRAAYTQAEGREIKLTAGQGVLRPRDQILRLEGGVNLTTSDGYKVETDVVSADLKAGSAFAPGPVRAEGPAGSIASGSFRARRVEGAPEAQETGASRGEALGALKPGDYLWFEDGVRVIWTPPPDARPETAPVE